MKSAVDFLMRCSGRLSCLVVLLTSLGLSGCGGRTSTSNARETDSADASVDDGSTDDTDDDDTSSDDTSSDDVDDDDLPSDDDTDDGQPSDDDTDDGQPSDDDTDDGQPSDDPTDSPVTDDMSDGDPPLHETDEDDLPNDGSDDDAATDDGPAPAVDAGLVPDDGSSQPPVAEQCRRAQRPLGDGLQQCASGLVHRVTPPSCDDELPRAGFTAWPLPAELVTTDAGVAPLPELPLDYYAESGTTYSYSCFEDIDCSDRSHGYCQRSGGTDEAISSCAYGCLSDADCKPDEICECAAPAGRCVPAQCATDGDCAEGELCARYSYGCDPTVGYACTSPDDRCRTGTDCDSEQCAYDDSSGNRVCVSACAED